MTFERQVGRFVRDWKPEGGKKPLGFELGLWLYFVDKNGRGWAQPDICIFFADLVVVLECKLTQADGAESQCMELYKPLLEMLYERPVVCCQVCKNLRYEVRGRMVEDLDELLQKRGYWIWHKPLK